MRTDLRAIAFGLAALLVLPGLAEAREGRGAKSTPKPHDRAAAAVSAGFQARMSRLDALMGGATRSTAPRSRSANADF